MERTRTQGQEFFVADTWEEMHGILVDAEALAQEKGYSKAYSNIAVQAHSVHGAGLAQRDMDALLALGYFDEETVEGGYLWEYIWEEVLFCNERQEEVWLQALLEYFHEEYSRACADMAEDTAEEDTDEWQMVACGLAYLAWHGEEDEQDMGDYWEDLAYRLECGEELYDEEWESLYDANARMVECRGAYWWQAFVD